MLTDSFYTLLQNDARQLLAVLEGIIPDDLHRAGDAQFAADVALTESIFANLGHRLREAHLLDAALIEGIVVNRRQAREVVQFLKSNNISVLMKHRPKRCHTRCLFCAQLAIAVTVPILNAKGLHIAVGKLNQAC